MKKSNVLWVGYFSIVFLLSSILFACSGGTNYVGGSSSSEGSSSETTYTITISDSITNGTVTASKTKAEAGEEITLTVTPSDGYAPDTLTVKDAGGADVTVTANKFTMPAKNVTVSAVFKVATVTYSVTVDGAITGGAVGSDKTTGVSAGETVTLTITRDGGKVLDALTVKDASNNAVATTAVVAGTTYTFTMPESNVSVTATFKAILGSKVSPDAVGDIVFNDGSAEAYSDSLTLTTEQIAGAVAVIFDAASKKGVGLRQGTSKAWAATSTPGYTTNISTLATTKDSGSTPADAVFSGAGATDGSGSLAKFRTAVGVADGTALSSTDYPAWAFVESYATTASLTGPYASGWYMPSIAELCKLYQAKTDVNNSLNKITGATQLSTSVYWSSSQDESSRLSAWYVYFGSGDLDIVNKDYTSSVCAVRAF
ncbi:MAG: DUF1566 domain-containing protein [Treponema sp.]|nr:DUF1566 domain-containing protein [Treponema sp.]